MRAEVLGAVTMLAATGAVVASNGSGAWIGLGLLAKSGVEAAVVGRSPAIYREGASSFRPGPEWVGQIMTYLVANTDYFLIAVLLGPVDLSLYVVAYQATAAVPLLAGKAFMQMTFLDASAATTAQGRQEAYSSHVRRAGALGIAGGVRGRRRGADHAVGARRRLGTDRVVDGRPGRRRPRPHAARHHRCAQGITGGAATAVVRWEAGRLVAMATSVAAAAVTGGLLAAATAVAVVSTASITVEHVLSCRVAGVRPHRLVVPWAVAAAVLAAALAAVLA